MTTLLEQPGFSVRTAAKYLGVSRATLYRWLDEGRISGELDACGQLVIPYGELYSAIKEQECESVK